FYFFDKNWNFLRYNKGDEKFPENFTIEEPENLDEMIKVAEKLSKPFSYARIDLYNLNGKVYFSEITLSPNSGFDTDITYSTDKLLGDKLHIPYAF
ncbi:TPA: ATP-grasp fold amidoligase family protein, partial [Clostridium perfringens]